MEELMKMQRVGMAVLGLALGMSAGLARAQSGGVSARIPFKFSVAGRTFAAGDYRMDVGSQQVTVVSLGDGRTVAMALANKVSGKDAGKTGRVVFRCYREHCFLAEVWSPRADEGRQVVATRMERDAAKEGEETYFAVLGSEGKR
jgi:hypothetical protein